MRWHAVNLHPGFKFNKHNKSEWLHPCVIIQAMHPTLDVACYNFFSCSSRRVTDVPLPLNRMHMSPMLHLLLHVNSNQLSYKRSQATAGWRSDHNGERCKHTGKMRSFLNWITSLETDHMINISCAQGEICFEHVQVTTQFYSTDISHMHDVST